MRNNYVIVCLLVGKKCSICLISLSICRSPASYYAVLGVKPDASLEEIKNAFFDKSKKVLIHNIRIARSQLLNTSIRPTLYADS